MTTTDELAAFAAQAKESVESGKPLFWTMTSVQESAMKRMMGEVGAVLELVNRPDLKKNLLYCLNELSVNALKAMVKRLYFQDIGLDIENPEHYERGIRGFRDAWLSDMSKWEGRLLELKRCYQVAVVCKEALISFFVVNAGHMVRNEIERIQKSIEQAAPVDCDTLENFEVGVGQEEGGGLGIFLINKLLQNAGYTNSPFAYSSEGEKTIFYLRVPLYKTPKESGKIHSALAGEIEKLPPFPDVINQIHKKLENPNVKLDDVAVLVKQDPGLTANLFKTANSVAFAKLKQVTEVKDGLAFIGIKGLKMLLYAYGMEVVMSNRAFFQQVTEHSFQVANIAASLAKQHAPDQKELAYVGGLLHDIGRIVILEQRNKFLETVTKLHKAGEITDWALENITFGLDHSELGGMVGERWNYPPILVSCIRHHHDVEECPPDHIKIAELVYFADLVPKIVAGEFPFYLLNTGVAARLGLKSEEEMNKLAVSLFKQTQTKERKADENPPDNG